MGGVFASAVEAAFGEMRAENGGDGAWFGGDRFIGALAKYLREFFGGQVDALVELGNRRLADRLGRPTRLALADAAEKQVADLTEASLGVGLILVHCYFGFWIFDFRFVIGIQSKIRDPKSKMNSVHFNDVVQLAELVGFDVGVVRIGHPFAVNDEAIAISAREAAAWFSSGLCLRWTSAWTSAASR